VHSERGIIIRVGIQIRKGGGPGSKEERNGRKAMRSRVANSKAH
jgi:hypothetical protein